MGIYGQQQKNQVKKAIQQFISHLQVERQYATNTQQAYQADLQELLGFTNQHQLHYWGDFTDEMFSLWMMNLRNRGNSARSIARKLSAARVFFAYLIKQNILSVNPTLHLKPLKIEKNLPKTLDFPQILKLIQPKSQALQELRDIAIVETLYSSGLRVSELVGLNVADVDITSGFLTVFGKGGKMRHTPLGKRPNQSIMRYLSESGHTKGALFVSQQQRRISIRTVQTMIKKRALSAGIKINVHPHMLRHSAATHLLQSSHDLPCVKDFLGHKSIVSTQTYTFLDFLDLAKVYDQCHPRAKR